MSTTLVLNTAVIIHPVPHRIVGGEPQTLAAQHCILKQHQKYVQSRVDVLDGGADGMNRDGDLDFAHGTVPRVRAVFTTLLSRRCQSFEILAPRAVTQRGQIDIMIVAPPRCTMLARRASDSFVCCRPNRGAVVGCHLCRSRLQGLGTNRSRTTRGSGAKAPLYTPLKNPASICAGKYVYNR